MESFPQDLEEEVIAEPDELISTPNAFNPLFFLQSNGWYMLISSVLLYYLWKYKISHLYEKWTSHNNGDDHSSKIHIDPNINLARERAREAAIEKFQNNYDQQVAKMKKIWDEKEEKKRQQYISKMSAVLPGRRLNEDFNPLTGAGGPNYRPPRRSCPNSSCGGR